MTFYIISVLVALIIGWFANTLFGEFKSHKVPRTKARIVKCPECRANYHRRHALERISRDEGCMHCGNSLKGIFAVS